MRHKWQEVILIKFIKSLHLKNFQSHKDSYLEFNPNLNTILGPSDSGKTSVIRGLKWVLFNEPSGNSFIREGETECSVTLELSDGNKIERLRTPSKNLYIIQDTQGEELVLSGFGLDVPEEVVELTGIRKIKFDKDYLEKINLGEQLDGPFLLSEKNSTKASAIGSLVGIEIIDNAVNNVLKDLRAYGVIEKKNLSEIEELRAELETYDDLDKDKRLLEDLRAIEKELQIKKDKLEKLKLLKDKYSYIVKELKNTEKIVRKLGEISKIKEYYNNINIKNQTCKSYLRLQDRYLINVFNIDENKKDLEKLSNLSKLLNLYREIELKVSLYKNYTRIFISYVNNKNSSIKINKSLNNLKKTEDLSKIHREVYDKLKIHKKLTDYNMVYMNILTRIKKGEEYIKRFDYSDESKELYASIFEKTRKIKAFNKLYKNLELVNKQLNDNNKIYKEICKEIDDKSNDYTELLKEHKVCPYCLSDIDDKKIDDIAKHYQ